MSERSARGRGITVLGSINVDFVQHVDRMPGAGETLEASDVERHLGGKGANQAYAAARVGGPVRLFGAIGDSASDEELLKQLRGAGVDISGVRRCAKPTGIAMILVLPRGENSIVISPGANAEVTGEMVLGATATISKDDVLLCQLEIPMSAVEAAMREGAERGAITILDPAPVREFSRTVLEHVHILTPNAVEAAALLGKPAVLASIDEARMAAQELLARGPKRVIVKLGSLGAVVADGESTRHVPAFEVEAVDTTAAGDAFNGGLAAALCEGASLWEAAHFASAVAALSVTVPGATSSMPGRREVEQLLQRKTLR